MSIGHRSNTLTLSTGKEGKKFEETVEDHMKQLPCVADVETQVEEDSVSLISCVDVVLTLVNGKKVYVPVTRDLWTGTFQIDRLESFYLKKDLGKLNGFNVFYCVEGDLQRQLAYKPKNARVRRKVNVTKMLTKLYQQKAIGEIKDLQDYVESIANS